MGICAAYWRCTGLQTLAYVFRVSSVKNLILGSKSASTISGTKVLGVRFVVGEGERG